jgi:hypothetical protein
MANNSRGGASKSRLIRLSRGSLLLLVIMLPFSLLSRPPKIGFINYYYYNK